MKPYVTVLSAKKGEDTILVVYYSFSESKEEAVDTAMQACINHYSTSQGYSNHNVFVNRISDEFIIAAYEGIGGVGKED